MKLIDLEGGYSIHLPESGGKAGKGHNKTSTIQLRKESGGGYLIVASKRFTMDDPESRKAALRKVREKYNEDRTPKLI